MSAEAIREALEKYSQTLREVIEPNEPWWRVARALAMLRTKHAELPRKKHDNLPL